LNETGQPFPRPAWYERNVPKKGVTNSEREVGKNLPRDTSLLAGGLEDVEGSVRLETFTRKVREKRVPFQHDPSHYIPKGATRETAIGAQKKVPQKRGDRREPPREAAPLGRGKGLKRGRSKRGLRSASPDTLVLFLASVQGTNGGSSLGPLGGKRCEQGETLRGTSASRSSILIGGKKVLRL